MSRDTEKRLRLTFEKAQLVDGEVQRLSKQIAGLETQLSAVDWFLQREYREILISVPKPTPRNVDDVRMQLIETAAKVTSYAVTVQKLFQAHELNIRQFEELRTGANAASQRLMRLVVEHEMPNHNKALLLKEVLDDLNTLRMKYVVEDTLAALRKIRGVAEEALQSMKEEQGAQRDRLKRLNMQSGLEDEHALRALIQRLCKEDRSNDAFLHWLDPIGMQRARIIRDAPRQSQIATLKGYAELTADTVGKSGKTLDAVLSSSSYDLSALYKGPSFDTFVDYLQTRENYPLSGSSLWQRIVISYVLYAVDPHGGLQIGYLRATASDLRTTVGTMGELLRSLERYGTPKLLDDFRANLDAYCTENRSHHRREFLPVMHWKAIFSQRQQLTQENAHRIARTLFVRSAEIYRGLRLEDKASSASINEAVKELNEMLETVSRLESDHRRAVGTRVRFLITVANELVKHGEYFFSAIVTDFIRGHVEAGSTKHEFTAKAKKHAKRSSVYQELTRIFDAHGGHKNLQEHMAQRTFYVPHFNLMAKQLSMLDETRSGEEHRQFVEISERTLWHQEAAWLWAQILGAGS